MASRLLSFSPRLALAALASASLYPSLSRPLPQLEPPLEPPLTSGSPPALPALPDLTTLSNWSGTHSSTLLVHAPESPSEVASLVARCHAEGTPLRAVGSHLSPNALSFPETEAGPGAAPRQVVSLALLDKVLAVDAAASTVTVQAGCRVSSLIAALRPHGLTLPQLASIAEQQVGGFVSVAAHGTGAAIPTVDDFVASFTVVTPSRGAVTFERGDELFPLLLVGLGQFGVLTELTLRCTPAHHLLERTSTLTRAEARRRLPELLGAHRHMRYMWVPTEDAVVVVTNDP
jgi:L-galactono-1,4-lactone dehydrogenase